MLITKKHGPRLMVSQIDILEWKKWKDSDSVLN
jgi:hypothetical protein